MTTEEAIDYIEAMWRMNDANIKLAVSENVELETEDLWAHQALKLVILQAKSNQYLEAFKEEENSSQQED